MVIYKEIYREYDNKYKRKSSGILIVDFETENPPLLFQIIIGETYGVVIINSSFIDNSFKEYAIKNQKPIDLNEEKITLNGFTLGDKIYLRNKDKGAGTALVLYFTPKEESTTEDNVGFYNPLYELGESGIGRNSLFALADYRYKMDLPVAYNDKNVSFQKVESITTGDMNFLYQSSLCTKETLGVKYLMNMKLTVFL